MYKTTLSVIIFTVAIYGSFVSSARILIVVPACSESHQRFFTNLWHGLADRGHDMVVLTTHPKLLEDRPNMKVINLNFTDCSYVQKIVSCDNSADVPLLYMTSYFLVAQQQLQSVEVQKILNNRSETFDLIMMEHFYIPMYGFKPRFNCPLIGLSSMAPLTEIHEIFGNPTHPILYPHALNFIPPHGFFNRLRLVTSNVYFKLIKLGRITMINELIKQSFQGISNPNIVDIFNGMDLCLMNWNPVFHGVMPLSPATVSITGLHVQQPRNLSQTLQKYADDAIQGMVFWSFGSTVKSGYVSDEKLQTIFDALSKLPYKVICKLDDSETQFNISSNVYLTKFVPQQDLLRHKNMKVFLTQGGLHSLEEAILAHVPVVVMPIIADQKNNAMKMVEHGIGVEISFHDFTADSLASAIKAVAISSEYKQRAQEVASWMHDDPISPLEKAIWWSEYVIRHKGTGHLKAPRLPFYQYYYLDIGLFYIALFYFIYRSLKFALLRLWTYNIKRKSD